MSLKLHNVTLSIQDLNTVIILFLQGEKQAIERMYYSFYNHGATDAELQEWCDTCAYIVVHGNGDTNVAHEKLFWAMTGGALFEILNRENTKGSNPMPRAMEIAEQRIAAMDRVNWYSQECSLPEIYSFGNSVSAEKDTGNFDSDVLSRVLERNGNKDADRHQRVLEYQDEAKCEEPLPTIKGRTLLRMEEIPDKY